MAKQNDFSIQKEEFIVEKNLFIQWFLYKYFLSNLKCAHTELITIGSGRR